jgi:hypothetical protein
MHYRFTILISKTLGFIARNISCTDAGANASASVGIVSDMVQMRGYEIFKNTKIRL